MSSLRQVGRPGTRAMLRVRDGLSIVTYRRPRVFVDMDAWVMLPADGVLLMRVTPTNGQAFALALAEDELVAVFGAVRSTASNWCPAVCVSG
jgi:hypothetical protein